MKTPITQSEKWQKLQDDLDEKSFFEKTPDFQYLAIKKHIPAGNYLYLPYGPVAKDEAGFKKALKSLETLAKGNHSTFIRIEPQNTAFTKYLPKSAKKTKDLSPKDTWVLDLTPDEATLITNFSQGTRTRYHNYAKKGLVVETTTTPSDIKYLVDLQHKLAKLRGIHAYDQNYLKTELEQPFSTLYLVKYLKEQDTTDQPNTPEDDQILATSLFFDYEDTRYYMQSAADQTYKKLPATVALLTAAIFDAKKKGIKYFDFWGIAPEGADSTHPWYGFTEFKKSFGGEPRSYAGTYDIVLKPARYKIYQLLRKIRRMV